MMMMMVMPKKRQIKFPHSSALTCNVNNCEQIVEFLERKGESDGREVLEENRKGYLLLLYYRLTLSHLHPHIKQLDIPYNNKFVMKLIPIRDSLITGNGIMDPDFGAT